MASSNLRRSGYLAPPSTSDSDSSSAQVTDLEGARKRKREANVYDAVAGRVTTTRPLDDVSDSEALRRRSSALRDSVMAPEEVLFSRINAPVRYAEKDIYNAHERLPDGVRQGLPDSDMLKAIHGYSAQFYSSRARSDHPTTDRRTGAPVAVPAPRSIDERSMDETALLAFGILLEEAARDVLGRKGDLVFTEGVDVDDKGPLGLAETSAVGFLDVDPSRPRPKRRGGV